MARGFGSTYGSGATDAITTPSYDRPEKRSWNLWQIRHGSGGGGQGRLLDNAAGASVVLRHGSGVLVYTVEWSGGNGVWSCPLPTLDAWEAIGVSYDGGSTANNPAIYIAGAAQTVTRVSAPSGTRATGAGALLIGNRSATDRVWDGVIAEFAEWDTLLGDAEFAALSRNSPWGVRPANLVGYTPLWGVHSSEPDLRKQGVCTVSGALRANHAPIAMRTRGRFYPIDHSTSGYAANEHLPPLMLVNLGRMMGRR